MDNINIYTKTYKAHLDVLHSILTKSRNLNTTSRLDKCQFMKTSPIILRFLVEYDSIRPIPNKKNQYVYKCAATIDARPAFYLLVFGAVLQFHAVLPLSCGS